MSKEAFICFGLGWLIPLEYPPTEKISDYQGVFLRALEIGSLTRYVTK